MPQVCFEENGEKVYVHCMVQGWPSFCGGNIAYRFAKTAQPSAYTRVIQVATPEEGARGLIENSITFGSVALADRITNEGYKYIISKLPRQWTNKTLGYTYYVSKSKVYKNAVHNSDVAHCTVYRKAYKPRPKLVGKKRTASRQVKETAHAR